MRFRRSDVSDTPLGLPFPLAQSRRGIALMGTLVALLILSLMMTAVVWQIMATRRTLEHREYELQAVWLARAGAELAAAHLLANPSGYSGEVVELIPGSSVSVEVRSEDSSSDTFRITSEARYPAQAVGGVVRSVTRHYRRQVDGERVRLQVMLDH